MWSLRSCRPWKQRFKMGNGPAMQQQGGPGDGDLESWAWDSQPGEGQDDLENSQGGR